MPFNDLAQALAYVRSNEKVLTEFVAGYHPTRSSTRPKLSVPITAPSAEIARKMVERSIRRTEQSSESPESRFKQAVKDGNYGAIVDIIQAAWFGVPESTGCWQIPGFKEAVTILENGEF